jgi:two-component system, cell cycle sensor histidine kinase and response regulator CckA
MLRVYLLLPSIAVQLAAALVALGLIRRTRNRLAWLLLCLAFVLMALRRLVSLAMLPGSFHFFGATWLSELANTDAYEAIGLALSVLLLGGVVGMGSVLRQAVEDADQAKRAADDLASSENRYRAIVEDQSELIVRFLADGTITFVNEATCRTFGMSAEDLLGKSFFGVLSSDALARVEAVLAEAAGDVEERTIEYQTTLPNGMAIWLRWHLRALAQPTGGPRKYQAVGHDVTEQKTAESRLAEQNRFLNTVLASLTHPFYVIDATDYRVVLANPASGLETGGRRSTCYAATHHRSGPCDDNGLQCPLAQVKRSRAPITVEHVHYLHGGEPRVFEVHGYPILGPDGDVVQMIEYSLEITSRRAAEQAQQRLIRALEVAAEIGAMLLEAQDPSDVLGQIVGKVGPAAEVSRCYYFRVQPNGDGAAVMTQAAEWCAPGVPPHWADGASRDVSVAAFPTLAGHLGRGRVLAAATTELPPADQEVLVRWGVKALVLLPVMVHGSWRGFFGFDDCQRERLWTHPELTLLVTGTHAFQLALERYERAQQTLELATVVEQAAEAVITTDARGRIRYVNEAFTRMTGVPREVAIGRPAVQPVPGQVGLANCEEIVATVGRGEVWHGVATVTRADGSALNTQGTAFPLRNQRGAVVGAASINADISDQLILEERLRGAQKMEALGQFASGIAHDFSNLVMVILGSAELLQRWTPADQPLHGELGVIRRTAERAAELARGLLAFSRRQLMRLEHVDLGALVRATVPLLSRLLPEHIELTVDDPPMPCCTRADRGQIEQVLLNLAVNARDAMPHGGHLRFRVCESTIDESYVAEHPWATVGSYVRLDVTDSGIGMDEATAVRVFEPFFTTKEPGKGTGLGLATVYGIIKQHGGMIDVTTALGRGTTFTVYLPRSAGEPAPDTRPATQRGSSRGERILLVEDNQDLRGIVARHLVELGYRVVEATDGLNALELLERGESFDLVLSDVVMPRLGGVNLFTKVRELQPDMAFLLTSGYAPDDPSLNELPADDRVGFLAKPYVIDVLAAKLRELLDSSPPANPPDGGSPAG